MYTIQVTKDWRSEYGAEECPMFYYIVWDENFTIVFEMDWDYGSPDERTVNRFMEAYFPGIDFVIEGDI